MLIYYDQWKIYKNIINSKIVSLINGLKYEIVVIEYEKKFIE